MSYPHTADAAAEFSPFEVVVGVREHGVLLLADHARNTVPAQYGQLGLPASEFERHIAYDIGVEKVVKGLAARLELPAVLSCFSRLLIDANRGVDDPTLIMQLSDGSIIPGNASLSPQEREIRLNTYHRPYHKQIDAEIDAIIESGIKPVLISVHSFTPAWKGVPRPWHVGMLWEDDRRCSDLFIQALSRDPSLVVGDNEPYSGGLEGDCMNVHSVKRGLPHTLIEIRQDLIADDAGVEEWVDRLGNVIEELLANDEFARLNADNAKQ